MGEQIGPTVMKFGGTSVGDVAAFERVVAIATAQIERRPVVVVSAMTGVTDALLDAFDKAKRDDFAGAVAALEPLRNPLANQWQSRFRSRQ